MNEPIKGDTDIAIQFLMRWAPNSIWTLTAVDPNKKPGDEKQGITTQSFDANSVQAARAFIQHWNEDRNLYFMVNASRSHVASKAKKEHVGWMMALHVDIDPKKPSKEATPEEIEEHYASENQRIKGLLDVFEPQPTVVIFSGGGYQGFWKLAQPVEIDEPTTETPAPWAPLELYNRQLEKLLGADSCFDIARIMRLPGTVNLPNKKKRENGRKSALARIEFADWEKKYDLSNFTQYVEEEKPKRKAKTSNRRAKSDDDDVDRIILNGPDHEGPKAFGGNRSNAVFWVACTLVRRGFTDDEVIAVLLDKGNKISEHVHDQDNPSKYATRQAARARDKVGVVFEVDNKDLPLKSQANIRIALDNMNVRVSYNAFNRKDFIEDEGGLRVMQDIDLINMRLQIEEDFNIKYEKKYFEDFIMRESRTHVFHPVKDYLDGLKWDGNKRIDNWLTTYAGTAETPYTNVVGALVLIAAVRRVRHPGCKFDEMLVLESPQGKNKSTALSVLAVNPEWFSDSLPLNASDKEVIEMLDGKWIVEAPELKGMNGQKMDHLKAMLSRQVDRARLSYGRILSEVPRQNVIVATTNTEAYLSDPTGNRRFWPVKIVEFLISELKRDVHQLWAEASMREAAGEEIRLPMQFYAEAAEHQEARMIDDPWKDILEGALVNTPIGKILCADIWNIFNIPDGMKSQWHNQRMGETMRKLGWDRRALSVKGRTAKCYVKGDENERQRRIIIERDYQGAVTIKYHDDTEARTVMGVAAAPDQDIPF